MAERVYIHIGAPKTGTTYLQQALGLSRDRLARAGVLYPPGAADAHHLGVWDLRDMSEQRENNPRIRGAWQRTVDESSAGTDRPRCCRASCSCTPTKNEVSRALTSFGDVEVHVIYTARDLVRQVPAVWQERLKNQRTMPYEQFVQDVIGRSRSGMAQGFWAAQDAPSALLRWSRGLAADRVHVVTMPPSGSPPHVLWHRFLSVLGLDGSAYLVDVPAVNPSMGIVEAEVLRRLNQRHGHAVGPVTYRKVFRNGLFDVLSEVVADSAKIVLRPDEHNALVQRGRDVAEGIRSAGYDVVGSLEDLVPPRMDPDSPAATARRPADVRPAEVIETLLDVVNALLIENRQTREALAKTDRRKRGSGRSSPRQPGDAEELDQQLP